MKEIKGKSLMTISTENNGEYVIDYGTAVRVNILNKTGGAVCINSSGTFTDSDGVRNYLELPHNTGDTAYCSRSGKIYVKSAIAGDLIMERVC